MIKDIDKKTDEDLVFLVLENQDYFLYLVRRYEKKLGRYISRISNLSSDDMEDILQDVFIKIYKNLNAFDTSLKFSSWAYRITHNEVISNYRKLKNKATVISFDLDGEFIKNIADDLDIEKNLNLKDLKTDISLILNKMDLKYREVLILKYLEEKKYNEISDILKKPEGTVATLLNRAKKQFLKIVDELNLKI
ncbi:MAG: sigma-70 family RNA polymerase sigma factor [Candidatus Pacebacteria bacterium]|nr:sigma-70 family RNA polymerase sigma factor [Candidatus Paceibacterota bacterium]